MISGAQAKAGRELLGWSLLTMSAKCGLGPTVIERFETGELQLSSFKALAIRLALEAGGVEFYDEVDGVKTEGVRRWRGMDQSNWAARRASLIQLALRLLGTVLFLAAASYTARHFAHQSSKHRYVAIITVCIVVMAVGFLRAWAVDERHARWVRQFAGRTLPGN